MGLGTRMLGSVTHVAMVVGALTALAAVTGCAGYDFGGLLPGDVTAPAKTQEQRLQQAIQDIDAARFQDQAQRAAAAGQPVPKQSPLAQMDPGVCDPLRNAITPRVHSIGLSKILTFKKVADSDDPNGIGLEIPVEGRDLIYPGCLQVAVKVTGTINAEMGKDEKLHKGPTGSGAMTISLSNRYLKKLNTGDHIDVFVFVNALPKMEPNSNCRLVTYAHRRFTLYTVDDFRDLVQKVRVPANDIQAFPLPEKEAEILFGPIVSENFFAVRLSVRNATDADKLISTGMITASGRILVEPKARKGCENKVAPPFTLPVEIVPQSLEQVYTMVDDEEVTQGRSYFFRGLEFAGALATAIVGAYPGPRDVLTGVGLFTGVAVPELRRAWPDRWPGYERNIVAYSMPDLFKVPKGSVAGHKYVFFSKNKLEAVISDQQYFGSFGDNGQPEQPDVAVAQVRFDSLDIPYENVFTVEASTIQRQVADLRADLPKVTERVDRLRAWGQAASMLSGALAFQDYQQLLTDFTQSPIDRLKIAAPPAAFTGPRDAAVAALSTLDSALKGLEDAAAQQQAAVTAPNAVITAGFPNVASNVTTPLATLSSAGGAMPAALTDLAAVYNDMAHIYVSDANTVERFAKGLDDQGKELAVSLQELQTIAAGATDPAPVTKLLSELAPKLKAAREIVAEAMSALQSTRVSAQVLADQVKILQSVAQGLAKSKIDVALINDSGHGLSALQDFDRELRNIFRDITAGRDVSGQREKVNNIRTEIETARRKIDFYDTAADVFRRGDDGVLIKKLKKLGGVLPNDRKGWSEAISDLNTTAIEPLRSQHDGLSIIPELTEQVASQGS